MKRHLDTSDALIFALMAWIVTVGVVGAFHLNGVIVASKDAYYGVIVAAAAIEIVAAFAVCSAVNRRRGYQAKDPDGSGG